MFSMSVSAAVPLIDIYPYIFLMLMVSPVAARIDRFASTISFFLRSIEYDAGPVAEMVNSPAPIVIAVPLDFCSVHVAVESAVGLAGRAVESTVTP